MDPIDRAIERCTVLDTTPDHLLSAPLRTVDPVKFRELLEAVLDAGKWTTTETEITTVLAELYPETEEGRDG